MAQTSTGLSIFVNTLGLIKRSYDITVNCHLCRFDRSEGNFYWLGGLLYVKVRVLLSRDVNHWPFWMAPRIDRGVSVTQLGST